MKLLMLALLMFTGHVSLAQTVKIENNQLAVDKPVAFKTGTAEITKESESTLQTIKQFLIDKSYISTLRIEGHVAGIDKNQTLSEQRALAVAQWLIKNGIECNRLMAVGFGDTKPVVESNAPGTSSNTRIVFALAALRNKAIGGMPLDGGGKPAGSACQ